MIHDIDLEQKVSAPKKPSTLTEFPNEAIEKISEILLRHDYVMKERIGCGGFSIIFKIYSNKYSTDFAAKITNTASTRHKTSSITTKIEENALQHLNHPNIIKLYESFHEQNYSFLILELCTSKSLRTLIGKKGISDMDALFTYMKQLTDALLFCHEKGFVHRDIKPANVLVDSYGHLKLADFGMCIHVNPNEKLHDYAGSPQYLAPEIINRKHFNPFKADIWALGVTFYEMAMGPLQWPKDKNLVVASIADGGIVIKNETPHKVATLVRKMLEMNPDNRPTIEMVASYKCIKNAQNIEIKQPPQRSPSMLKLPLAQRSSLKRMPGNRFLPIYRQRSNITMFSMPIIHEMKKDSTNL